MLRPEVILFTSTFAVSACSACASKSPISLQDVQDGGVDAVQVDTRPADVKMDVKDVNNLQPLPEFTGWPGWHRSAAYLALHPRCSVYVPDHLGLAPKFEWIPCSNGTPHCQQMKLTPQSPDMDGYEDIVKMQVTKDKDGKGKLVIMTRNLSWGGNEGQEHVVYDFITMQPLAAWRRSTGGQDGNLSVVTIMAGGERVGLDIMLPYEVKPFHYQYLDINTPTELLKSPKPQLPIGFNPRFGFANAPIMGEQVVMADHESGAIHRIDVATRKLTTIRNSEARLLAPSGLVVGQDTYASSDHGYNGWVNYYRVDDDGTVTRWLDKQGAHMWGAATDGTNLFWVETTGAATATGLPPTEYDQPIYEFWASTYSRDPEVVRKNARKLGTYSSEGRRPYESVSFDGAYVNNPGKKFSMVYLADGRSKRVDAGGTWLISTPVYVSPKELWAKYAEDDRSSCIGVVRYELGDW